MPVKVLNMGESGGGKTGALASLCVAGFNVRLADLENGVEALINVLTDPASKYPKDAISRLRWRTLTEPMRVLNGNLVARQATVWPTLVAMLESWQGDSRFDVKTQQIVKCEDKLGSIYNWTEKDVFALDTLTALGDAANNHYLQMQGQLGNKRSSMEMMRDTGSAQGMIDKFLQFMRDTNLKANVIINTHVNWAKEDGSPAEVGYEGVKYAFPSAIGKALNLKIGRNFNHMLMTRKVGISSRIHTRGIANAALKSGAPLKVRESYDIVNGLAEYFADVNKSGVSS